jgi:charged multivesicular body protein 2A
VRTRRYVKKFMLMRANIQAVSLKIQTLKSQSAMAQAMKGVTKAMGSMNKQMKLPEIQKIMMEFEKQSEIMDMKGEMMEDAIGKSTFLINYCRIVCFLSPLDDVMGDEEDEEESDAIVNQVLDELGLQLNDKLGDVPVASGSLAAPKGAAANKNKTPVAAAADDDDADLQARLDDLRRE